MNFQVKKSYYVALAVVVVGATSFFIFRSRPCDSPIKYKIGVIDKGYTIGHEEFRRDIKDAADLWSTKVGKKLFEYDEKGELTINLIYDNRQKIVDLRKDINQTLDSANVIKDKFVAMKKQYELQKFSYEKALADFNTNVSKYSKSEYELKRQQLEIQRTSLNELSNQLKIYADKYNTIAKDINSNVEIVNQNTGEVEQGLYSAGSDNIDLYSYESKERFTRIIAHELGHALGLDHNDNPDSIMYKLNLGREQKLSPEDTKAIKTICRVL